jgi:hypothetical protein
VQSVFNHKYVRLPVCQQSYHLLPRFLKPRGGVDGLVSIFPWVLEPVGMAQGSPTPRSLFPTLKPSRRIQTPQDTRLLASHFFKLCHAPMQTVVLGTLVDPAEQQYDMLWHHSC